jgi:hypothetical protein
LYYDNIKVMYVIILPLQAYSFTNFIE